MRIEWHTAARYCATRYSLPLVSVWLVLLMEFLTRDSLSETWSWGVHRFEQLFFNTVIVFILLLVFTALTGRTRWAFWLISAPLLLLSLVSGIKQRILGVPLLPMDFFLTSETSEMTQYIKHIFTVSDICGIVVFIAGGYCLLHKLPHQNPQATWRERSAMAVTAALLFFFVCSDQPFSLKQVAGIDNISWNQTENVRTNGFALSAILNLKHLSVKQLNGYNGKTIDNILSQTDITTNVPTDGGGIKPNIIVVLSESFFDETTLPGLTFSRDPLPFFHELQKKYTHGTFLSPQFGGGTANVEFEVLTGNSMRFMEQGSIPYNQYINHPVDSLASITARQGYRSTAISPFYNWFFNSRNVYRNLGFGNFQSIEFFNPVYEGPYIADSEVANMIISESEKDARPHFIFANTMENHFHYYPGKFKTNTIHIQANVSRQSIGLLETYAHGLSDADKMLQTLVEHFNRTKEPTIILFFGDHKAALGDNYKVYRETKYISDKDDPNFLEKMYTTPFVVWNNYLPEHKDELYMSPSFIGPYLLNLAKLKGSYYTDYVGELYKKIPVIPPKNMYAAMNIKEEDLKQYEYLQYDIMFGDRHGYKEIEDKIINPNYSLGSGPMSVTSLSPASAYVGEANIKLTVTGQNFSHGSVVYIDDKAFPTTYVSETELSADLPASLFANDGSHNVDLRVIDNKNNIIMQSNVMKLEVTKK
ncbi:sulfatase-like hydrolase/transferase [Cohnella soli]|uniref:Sulfatase-like hydrolase/transferase n=1 Tax=Cohnella soli TaxID=425005 RepID=A0ABW0HS97_9BACL